MAHTLDKFVEQDYSIVYLHAGMERECRPPFSWFWNTYKIVDRKFKKNLKGLYLVHPTSVIRVIWQMFQVIISAKFGKKMKYVDYLYQLREDMRLEQLNIPDCVQEWVSFDISSVSYHLFSCKHTYKKHMVNILVT